MIIRWLPSHSVHSYVRVRYEVQHKFCSPQPHIQFTHTAWCKKVSPLFEIPASFLPSKMASQCTANWPCKTCITKLSSINFARPCSCQHFHTVCLNMRLLRAYHISFFSHFACPHSSLTRIILISVNKQKTIHPNHLALSI